MPKNIPLWLVNLLLVGLLAWLAAGLTWRLLSPEMPKTNDGATLGVPNPALSKPVVLPDLSRVESLFGVDGDTGAAVSSLNLKLRGLVAGSNRLATAAIFAGAGPKDVVVPIGGEIQSGVKLLEAEPGHVIVQNGGRRERIDLDAKPAAIIGGAESKGRAGNPINGEGMAGPSIVALKLPRAQLVVAMQSGNVAEWATGLRSDPSGGIRIEGGSARGLVQALQLQDGDILKKVNGRSLARPGDITLVYNEFSQKNKVQLDLVRGGKLLQIDYSLQS